MSGCELWEEWELWTGHLRMGMVGAELRALGRAIWLWGSELPWTSQGRNWISPASGAYSSQVDRQHSFHG